MSCTALAVTGLSLVAAPMVQAQDFPTKSLTLVVPYPAAGAADIFGRSIAQAMEATLKQIVVVENKPGASGTIGGKFVQSAAPDGQTLLFSASTHSLTRQVIV